MNSCTFFGHRNVYSNIYSHLNLVLTDLIENKNITVFYVGNQGAFDNIVLEVLKQLKNKYPQIIYTVVLAYMPSENAATEYENISVYPEEFTSVPRKFAIHHRNNWMVERSEYVITYVIRNNGGAALFKTIAEKKGKKVINIGDVPK